jgi:AcrR family transcriptional regulator
MNTLSRKQREIQARESLFLSTARDIIRAEGVTALTMERIADLTEYSKGTVYKHFTCKEDLVCALCGEGVGQLFELSQSMRHFEGCPREKLVVVALAYQTFMERFPEQFDLILAARQSDMRHKASPDRVAQVDEIDSLLMGLVREQIETAIHNGDLTLPAGMSHDDFCFGAWSLSFGVLSLYQARDVICALEIPKDVTMALFQHLNALLDGYSWRPLSREHDYLATLMRAHNHLQPMLSQAHGSTST